MTMATSARFRFLCLFLGDALTIYTYDRTTFD